MRMGDIFGEESVRGSHRVEDWPSERGEELAMQAERSMGVVRGSQGTQGHDSKVTGGEELEKERVLGLNAAGSHKEWDHCKVCPFRTGKS